MADNLLLAPDAPLTCPRCGEGFSLREGFAQHALEGIEASSNDELARLREQERATSDKRARQLAEEMVRARMNELAPQLEALKQKADERTQLEKRLAEMQQQNRALQNEQLQLRHDRQRLKDEQEALALSVQQQVDAQLAERERRARSAEQERATLEKAELQKQIDDMQQKLLEAQQKGQQRSQQLQGEVLELAMENDLLRAFPLDAVEEVRKGMRGGDVIHRIVTRGGQQAGTLLWETKRARDWSGQWAAKLKDDMRACGADVGVLVTTSSAIPSAWPPGQLFGLHEEIWVTTWGAALQLAQVLRQGMLDVHRQRIASSSKGEKMEAVYDYLTSPQFAQKLKAVYAAFRKMREELEQEKNVTLQRWARRDRQLQSGLTELLGVAGDLQGLAAQPLPMLELEPGTDEQP